MLDQARLYAARQDHHRFAKTLDSDLRRGLKEARRESVFLFQKIAWTKEDGRLVLSWRF